MSTMFDSTFSFLDAQVGALLRAVAAGALDAIPAWELQVRLNVAVAAHRGISDLDEHLADENLKSAGPLDRDLAEQVRTLYADWDRAITPLVHRLKALESAGVKLTGSEPFKDAVLDARSILSLSLDQLDESARQLREGSRRSMPEVVDGIRRRLGA